MAKRYTVHVTREIIDRAIKNNSRACMVANAVAASVPGSTNIDVTSQQIRFTDTDGFRYAFPTPSSAEWAIIDFDAGVDIEPFDFRLDRANAIKQARRVVTDPASKEKIRAASSERAAAKREGRDPDPEKISTAGVKKETVSSGRRPSTRPGGKGPGRPPSKRSYGHRVMKINQYRERDGLLPPKAEQEA